MCAFLHICWRDLLILPVFVKKGRQILNMCCPPSVATCKATHLRPCSRNGMQAGTSPPVPWPSPNRKMATLFPLKIYAAAKWASSGYARMFHVVETSGGYRKSLMVYGPAQQDLTKLIPYVTLSLLRGEMPKITVAEDRVDWMTCRTWSMVS